MGQILVFGLQSQGLGEGLEELEGRVDYEVEIELLDDIGLLLQNLLGVVLEGAARHELLEGWDLVGLLELSSNE